ncbi:alpha/beta fold hydrolase [Calothrix rhizosoleniae]|uniref:alpha/beta fold hydrolase n=1 Tax=Calothrix rhizosoleniae TaxID=888997 RepID=UPI000B4A0C61|nr:alpha/beta hydrolase [Calothrix rhizosoleniae]
MINSFDVLWLTASPSLKYFDQPLLKFLSKSLQVAQWEYHPAPDEASSIDKAVCLIDEFLQSYSRPVHLAGHSTGGAIALMFARRFPQKIKSLTLLSVGSQPAINWQAHYYVQRQMFFLSRERILANNGRSLFGYQPPHKMKKLVATLDRDLQESPCSHSPFKITSLPKGGVYMPLMVCGCKTDPVISPSLLHDWSNWFKPEDRLWECPRGLHFFHYFYPQNVGQQMLNFWQSLNLPSVPEKQSQSLEIPISEHNSQAFA